MRLTEEENRVVRNLIFLEFTRKTLEHDKKHIESSGVKIKDPYIEAMDKAIVKVGTEIRDLKRALHKGQIKIHEEGPRETEGSAKIYVYKLTKKGYEQRMDLASHVIKNAVVGLMRRFL
ncbi:hypothetical protein [Bacillus solitudinis]|uniref:hypothetical protein n=1 Tax=Bacillus solitudinis TaxID=2014074 RepID=UPI000C23D488|nr:hypothetical protein [Bacillus solitudinis]